LRLTKARRDQRIVYSHCWKKVFINSGYSFSFKSCLPTIAIISTISPFTLKTGLEVCIPIVIKNIFKNISMSISLDLIEGITGNPY